MATRIGLVAQKQVMGFKSGFMISQFCLLIFLHRAKLSINCFRITYHGYMWRVSYKDIHWIWIGFKLFKNSHVPSGLFYLSPSNSSWHIHYGLQFFNNVKVLVWYTTNRMWNMIASPATPTVCLEQNSENFCNVATWHYRCRHNLKNNCIWDDLQCCLLVPRSPSKPVMLTFDLQSRKV